MDLEFSRKTEEFISEIYQELPLEGKISSVKAKRLAGGYHNRVFLLVLNTISNKKFRSVLKLYDVRKFPYKGKAEFEALKYLKNERLGPKVYYFNPKSSLFKAPVILEEFIKGQTLGNLGFITEKQFKHIVDLMAKIHSNTFKKYGILPAAKKGTHLDFLRDQMDRSIKAFYGGYLENLKNAPPRIAGLKSKVEVHIKTCRKILSSYKNYFSGEVFCLTHGDFGLFHLVTSKGKMMILDWESSKSADPVAEIAYFFNRAKLSSRLKDKFLKLYDKQTDLVNESFLKRLEFYAVWDYLGDMLWSLERASIQPSGELKNYYLQDSLEILKTQQSYKEILFERLSLLETGLNNYK